MMTFQIITAAQRLAEQKGSKLCILGPSGIGKTSLLWTLPHAETLFFDLEAGDLAIEGLEVDAIRPRTWQECRDFAAYIGGPNPALRPEQPYSQAHYDHIVAKFGDAAQLDKYSIIFVDSITVAGRLCLQHCMGQPEAFSEKTGKPDTRGAYGLHGREMLGWITHLQHTRGKTVIFVGILDKKTDDFNRAFWTPQIDGAKTALELPGIVDQVISFVEVKDENGVPRRAFVCQTLNSWGYPAKDRSGRLDLIEEPHLGRLLDKIGRPVKPAGERLEFGRPAVALATPTDH
jgi:hypothetical protein